MYRGMGEEDLRNFNSDYNDFRQKSNFERNYQMLNPSSNTVNRQNRNFLLPEVSNDNNTHNNIFGNPNNNHINNTYNDQNDENNKNTRKKRNFHALLK